jgi:hypothetical protein
MALQFDAATGALTAATTSRAAMRDKHRLAAAAVVCLSGVAVLSCHKQSEPPFTDTLGAISGCRPLTLWSNEIQEIAPIIIAGTVEENSVVSKHLRSSRYPDVYLDLHRVRCKRENSIRGGLTDNNLTFFYFADGAYPDSKANPCYRRLFEANPRSRYIFFLSWDRGALRSIGDVGDFSILISSGRHPDLAVGDSNAGATLSELLLKPGDGTDLRLLAMRLPDYAMIADWWGSRILTVRLLRSLLSAPEPVRSRACGELVAFYPGQDDCLETITRDPSESAEIRRWASDELHEATARRDRLVRSLKDPANFEYLDWAGDSRSRLREELEAILIAPDATLHALACGALRRYYPYDVNQLCASAK